MASVRAVCALVFLSLAASGSGAKVTPIQKVLELMQGLISKAEADLQDDKVKFAAFSQWCDNQKANKEEEIGESTEKIEKLKAEIYKMGVKLEELAARIAELEEDVGRWDKDMASATAVRNKEAGDFATTLSDIEDTLSAIGGAINVLNKNSGDVPQALLQVRRSRLISDGTRNALDSFLKGTSFDPAVIQGGQNTTGAALVQQPDGLAYEAPEANAYESQSGGIIDMLEKLKDQFEKQKYDLEKEELTARHGFDAIMQQLTDNIENGKYEIEKKTAETAATKKAKGQAEGDLAQTIADREEDQKYLDDMVALCTQKTDDYESRSALRAEEIETLKKAMEIIAGEAVQGAGDKHLPAFAQETAGQSLAHLRSREQSIEQTKVAMFLAQRAQTIGSRTLAMIAQRVEEDPFKKVKKMMKDLVYKLMEEAAAEAEHKGFCDTELTTNQQTRDKKTEEIKELNLQIEDLTAEISKLTQTIADLTAAIAEIDAAMAKATADREASKEKNAATIADAKKAQTAVESAMTMLKEFYAKASQATALSQQPAADAPATSGSFSGNQDAAGGIMDFLEVIISDFARLQSETETQEAMEQEEYEKVMHESKMDKALKENEIKHHEERKAQCESDLQTAREELAAAQEELAAAVAYYEKLKPKCVDSGITYEERVKQREEEIQSLKDALAMLEGLDLPSVGKPGMKFNKYEEEEYESKESKTVKFEASGSVSATSR